jgi:glycine dehydrogenase
MSTSDRPTLADLEGALPFVERHIGPREDELAKMLAVVGAGSLAELADAAVPEAIRATEGLELPAPLSEPEVLAELRALADRNRVTVPMIGTGYSGTHTPAVVLRNVLENPAWYTAYTPYQPEISQGRLEALLDFQTVIEDLTGLAVAGASLLDEGTAAAEAMTLARRTSKAADGAAFVVDADCHPQTIAVLQTRAEPLGLPVQVHDLSSGLPEGELFGILLQYPGSSGVVRDLGPVVAQAKGARRGRRRRRRPARAHPAHPARRARRRRRRRHQPALRRAAGLRRAARRLHERAQGPRAAHAGRLVGVSRDADGNPAHRLALQTREQHIRREKATSNICTAQVLLAVLAGMYAVYHGPGRAARHRGTHPPLRRAARRGRPRRGCRGGARRLLRHRDAARAGPGGRRRRRRPRRGRRAPAGGRRHPGRQHRRDDDARPPRRRRRRTRRAAAGLGRPGRGHPDAVPAELRAPAPT